MRLTLSSDDELDKLAGVTDPLSNSWAYTYDPNYNLSTVTNPRGATTSYTYSANDRLEATTDALGHTWAFTHDLPAQSAYSTGESYAFSYTPTHRLAGVTGTGGAFGFTYNGLGIDPLVLTPCSGRVRMHPSGKESAWQDRRRGIRRSSSARR